MFSKGNSGAPQAPAIDRKVKSNTMSMPSIVSSNLKITGDLTSDGDIQIEGLVEGNVTSRMLTIGESGTVKGEIIADSVTVAGAVDGKIEARTVTLAQTSDVTGDISHEALGIEAGARFEGSCKKVDFSKRSPIGEVSGKPLSGAGVTSGSGTAQVASAAGADVARKSV